MGTRHRCYRCKKPATYEWSICADGNRPRWVCLRCDIALNRMVLKWARDPRWKQKIERYIRERPAA